MESKTPHTVKLIGLSDNEQKVLSTIFMLSKTRPASFCLFGGDQNSKPEIMIVNFDDSEAVHEWQTLCIQDAEYSSVPVVRVTSTKFRDAGNYYTRRPFIATKILSLFERISAKEFDSDDDSIFKGDDLLE